MELKASLAGRFKRSCWENQQRKNKLVVDLSKTTQNLRWNYTTTKSLNSWEEWRNAKLHFRSKRRIICTSRREKKRYLNFSNKNLDELLKNELNHEEPPWRTPVTKDDEIKACDDLNGGSEKIAEEKLNSGKEKMKTLGTRIYSSRTNSEGRDYSLWENKNKIYCMPILHQVKLMTSNGFRILLILLEKDWEMTYRKLEKVFINHR